MTPKRCSFSTADKADAVRKHLIHKLPVSHIAEQMQVQTTLIHGSINTALTQVERALQTPRVAKAGKSTHPAQGLHRTRQVARQHHGII